MRCEHKRLLHIPMWKWYVEVIVQHYVHLYKVSSNTAHITYLSKADRRKDYKSDDLTFVHFVAPNLSWKQGLFSLYVCLLLGTCIDLVNNYTCNCNVGFTGRNCDIIIRNCTEDSCYPNVTCLKHNEKISCGPCPLGFSGDGKNCEGDVLVS